MYWNKCTKIISMETQPYNNTFHSNQACSYQFLFHPGYGVERMGKYKMLHRIQLIGSNSTPEKHSISSTMKHVESPQPQPQLQQQRFPL
jgi:hypothetical protein